MAAGFAHVISVGMVTDSAGVHVPQYQFAYNDGDNTYARIFDEAGLIEFLRDDLAIYPDILDRSLKELRSTGNTIIADIEIAQQEAAAMGLQQVATDN
jgi:hypothetical protein